MSIVRNILVRVGADISGLQKQLGEAQKAFSNAGRQLSSVGKSMTAYISAPLAGIGVLSLKTAADFEQAMSNIKAVSSATGDQMKDLTKLALKMGADTKYSAGEAAAGMEELLKAGLSVEQVLDGGLKGALNLAAAGEIELAEAAEIASTVLNAFRSDGLSVAQAADILAGSANASATSVGELRLSLQASSAVAAGVGFTFQDTATALALLAQNGLKGSDAGTSLKTMLMNLQPATKQQTALFKKLNLVNEKGQSLFFDAAGKIKSLADISGLLRDRLKGMTDAQRMSALEMMFGSDAIRAANILYKEGADGANTMKDAIGKVTAEEVAAEKMNNFKGSLEQLKGSLETAAISLGMIFLPALKRLADFLTKVTNKFMDLSPTAQKIIGIIAGIAIAAGPLLVVLGMMAQGVGALAGIIGFLLSPVGLIILAVAALVAGFIYLWNTNEDFRAAMIEIWGYIRDFLIATWEVIKAVATTIWDGLSSFWKAHGDQIKAAIVGTWEVIWAILQPIFETLAKIAITIFDGLRAFWREWGDEIIRIFQNAFELIYMVVAFVLDRIKTFWDNWGPLILAAIQTVLDGIYVAFQFVWSNIQTIVETVIGIIDGIIRFWLAVFQGDWSEAWNAIKDIYFAVWEGIKGILVNTFNYFKNLFGVFKAHISDLWSGLWNGVKGTISSIWGTIKGITTAGLDAIKEAIFNSLAGIGQLFNAFKEMAVGIWDGIIGGIKGTINFSIEMMNKFIRALNAIEIEVPSVDIPIVGEVGGFTVGLPDIPEVPKLAMGGVVTGPTLAMVGEGLEDEAVLPLSKLNAMLNSGDGGNTIVQVILDGRVIQEYVDNGIGKRMFGLGGAY